MSLLNPKLVLIAILTFLLGWQLGHRDVEVKWRSFKPTVSIINKDVPKNINVDFKLFWDTWDLLSRTYIDKSALDAQKLFYGAISGLVGAAGDPYTFFLPPEQQKATKEELGGSFSGVGIELGFNKDKKLVVVAPLAGTPAEKMGIKPQDLILEIDDKDITNITLAEAVKLIRGEKGTKVNLTIFREGATDTKTFALIRDTIVVKSVQLSFKDAQNGQVAVIKLSRFGERTEEEWNLVVEEIVSKNPKGLVLDARNNPGGYLQGAVFIASEFLDSQDIVVFQENNQGTREPFRVNRSGKLTKIPMVVVINKGSASAAEIVASALQDHKRARLLGDKSFGKGTIQEALDLGEGTGIHITVARWLTPNGKWVNDSQGLDPDVKIEADKEDQTKDPQLDKALEML